ncbi:MAG: hypothetical protein O2967_03085 [Proteobacteria bacterium]|nr:hypothetical protein [Pseudomonadota bacterium]
MIKLRAGNSPARDGPVALAFYASLAFRMTSPKEVGVMSNPWRNLRTAAAWMEQS